MSQKKMSTIKKGPSEKVHAFMACEGKKKKSGELQEVENAVPRLRQRGVIGRTRRKRKKRPLNMPLGQYIRRGSD